MWLKTECGALGQFERFPPPWQRDRAERHARVGMYPVDNSPMIRVGHSGLIQRAARQVDADRDASLTTVVDHGLVLSDSEKGSNECAAAALDERDDTLGIERAGVQGFDDRMITQHRLNDDVAHRLDQGSIDLGCTDAEGAVPTTGIDGLDEQCSPICAQRLGRRVGPNCRTVASQDGPASADTEQRVDAAHAGCGQDPSGLQLIVQHAHVGARVVITPKVLDELRWQVIDEVRPR